MEQRTGGAVSGKVGTEKDLSAFLLSIDNKNYGNHVPWNLFQSWMLTLLNRFLQGLAYVLGYSYV